jgi:transcriptional regulator of met regulon
LPQVKDWWNQGNAIVIWLTVFALLLIMVYTSGNNFEKFGANQLILAGIITFLLLYKSISKIKIGSFLEIETREAVRELQRGTNNLANALEYALASRTITDDADVRRAKASIVEAKKQIALSVEILEKLDNSAA